MMEQAPSTLLDRLVARTMRPAVTFTGPLDPVFDSWGEEATEHVAAPIPRVATRVEERSEPAESLRLRERTALPEHEPPPGHAETRTEPVFATSPIEPAGPVLLAHAVVPAVPAPTRLRMVHEVQTVDRLRVERRDAASPSLAGQNHVASASPLEASPVPDPVQVVIADLARPMPSARLSALPSATTHELRSDSLSVIQPDLPRAVPEAPRPQSSPAVPPESVIQVTIGRLEIRASEKEKPAKPRARTPEGPSLEQYLAKRRGGAS